MDHPDPVTPDDNTLRDDLKARGWIRVEYHNVVFYRAPDGGMVEESAAMTWAREQRRQSPGME